MSLALSIKAVNDWNKEIGVGLNTIMAVSMDIMGRSGEEAARHTLILMAQSARAAAKQSRKLRLLKQDEHGRYLEVLNKGTMSKLYEWAFSESGAGGSLKGTFEGARPIKSRGLAKRSWMWGLGRIGAKKTGRQISNASRVYTIKKPRLNGYIKEDRLDYIQKVMPAGWESTVVLRAGNKAMKQARNKMERDWKRGVKSRRSATTRAVSSLFKSL